MRDEQRLAFHVRRQKRRVVQYVKVIEVLVRRHQATHFCQMPAT
jgi:hypothetical protein